MTEWSQPIVETIWRDKYRHGEEGERINSFARVVSAVYAKDKGQGEAKRAMDAMEQLRWCPAGRIQAGAGTGNKVTLMNCYVAPTIQDSMETEVELTRRPNEAGILDALKTAAITQQMGGGIGMDFSTLRPEGARVKRTGTTASGPLPFMDMWDAMCRTVMSAGHRRGAMMATMRCDHPDIEKFITAKRQPGRLTNFNVSVLVTDAFMEAVKNDDDWRLRHESPPAGHDDKHWDRGDRWVYQTLPARELWDLILRNTYDHAEPGVIFINRVNAANNLKYCETIAATNPCGEQPLPPNGACNLGAVNLAVHVSGAFGDNPSIDWERLRDTVQVGVRFLDNVLDITQHPTAAQAEEARLKRRIGLGVTGLANMLQQLKLRYGSRAAVQTTATVMKFIAFHAYMESIELGDERGAFPLFKSSELQKQELIRELRWGGQGVVEALEDGGQLRNGVILTIAPTGTTSLYYDNVSSGIEPVFAHAYTRNVRQPDDTYRKQQVYDWGWLAYRKHLGLDPNGGWGSSKPDYMVTADQLTVEEHLQMQAACQRWVDASISKTINCPADMPFEEFKHVYTRAHDLGLKGCTTYRPNPASGRGAILETTGVVERAREEGLVFTEEDQASGDGVALRSEVHPGSVETMEIEMEEKPPTDHLKEMFKKYGGQPEPAKRPRPEYLRGLTRKVRWPSLDYAHYLTMNFDEAGAPFEVFITSKDATHQEWMQALSLLITGTLRKGGDTRFWVDELRQVHSAAGGHILSKEFTPSLVALIAKSFGEMLDQGLPPLVEVKANRVAPTGEFMHSEKDLELIKGIFNCPKCRAGHLTRKEGCEACDNCDYNKCG